VGMKDRRDANVLLGSASLENAAYLLQQSAEKILKAWLIANGQEPSRTHNIDKLMLSAAHIDPTITRVHAVGVGSERMTEFATYYRYPNPDKNDMARLDEVNGAIDFVNQLSICLKPFFGEAIWQQALDYAKLQDDPFDATLSDDEKINTHERPRG